MENLAHFISITRELFGTEHFIPLHVPVFRGNEKKYVLDTLDTTMVSSVGAYVDQFEAKLAAYVGVPRATAVVNGTAGLQVALKLVGVQPGDEVITQALTFVATANAIHHNHAQPVFVDVDRDTMGMSPQALEAFLTEFAEKRDDGAYNRKSGKRLGACMPMHTFGFICWIEEIVAICQEYRIPVVEDAAEALGSSFKGKNAGTSGDIGVYSFNGNKIITAGGGGALVSPSEALMQKAKYVTNTAKKPHQWEYVHDEYGYNFRMPNLNAALVCAQLEQLDEFRSLKQHLFQAYESRLGQLGIALKRPPATTDQWNHWLITVELENKTDRDAFLKATNEQGVMTGRSGS